jgi:histone acetyltransferase (RNA polymerase elongator complex component)
VTAERIVFQHPEPVPPVPSIRVWPVFLPFAGCPFRCVFCAQDKQTGRDEADLRAVLHSLERDLADALAAGRGPYELAFYGGTFTALPSPWPETFLALAARFRRAGLLTRVRCSTRPDCVDTPALAVLRDQGLDMVELGIQSFDDRALAAAGRGYDGETARRGCAAVTDAGLALGIQLLPGLPGDRPGLFQSDARQAAALAPEIARLYPCLVVRGTGLAGLWERGGYVPWDVERARRELAAALSVFWSRGVRVVRLGLAPEDTLEANVLAGPWHPALGQSARGLALLRVVEDAVRRLGRAPSRLDVPRRYQGEFFGHGRELAPGYEALGLSGRAVRYVDAREFVLV